MSHDLTNSNIIPFRAPLKNDSLQHIRETIINSELLAKLNDPDDTIPDFRKGFELARMLQGALLQAGEDPKKMTQENFSELHTLLPEVPEEALHFAESEWKRVKIPLGFSLLDQAKNAVALNQVDPQTSHIRFGPPSIQIKAQRIAALHKALFDLNPSAASISVRQAADFVCIPRMNAHRIIRKLEDEHVITFTNLTKTGSKKVKFGRLYVWNPLQNRPR